MAFSTINPGGEPQTTPVWCNVKGVHIWVNSVRGRRKDKNIERHPRISILAVDPNDNYSYPAIQGVVEEVTEQVGIDQIEELARLYTSHDRYYGGFQKAEQAHKEVRVIFKILPTRVHTSG